jgi:drug/metabolite transporter (DMT)-like permease
MSSRLGLRPTPTLLLSLCLGIVYLVWGSSFLAIHVALEGFPPFFMSALRFSLAGLLMLGLARALGHAWPKPREIAAAGLVGCLTLLAANATGVWAQQHISTSMAALLQASLPMWLLVLDVATRTRRATASSLLGTAMGIGGVLTLLGPNMAGGSAVAMWGAIAVLIGMLSWAVGMRLERGAPMPASGAMSAGVSMLAASVAFGAIAHTAGEPARVVWSAIPTNAWVALAYLTIVGSCITFSAFTWLNRNARPELASSFSYVNPLVAVMLGALVLGEPLNQGVLLSTILTVGAVLLVMLPPPASRRPKARPGLEPSF